ncbi:DUF7380 domain-containing protein [Acinetobacter pittii]|uniref:DUF7380 domain-containing protein n=1 Tax=Acinetobacter pittii TaxID=48296 RepID=A0A6H0FSE1_ACIPI|nr:hypothetical protein [Acinetobacter pittii]QIT17242.1 hypothetical protein G8E09_05690 [Acinetobacter pittii]
MNYHEIDLTITDLDNLNLNTLLSEKQTYTIREIEKIIIAEKDKNPNASLILQCLCGMLLQPSMIRQPYCARMSYENTRTAEPQDFTKETLKTLSEYCQKINNYFLQGRIADVIWVTKSGNIDFAILCIKSYFEGIKLLSKENIKDLEVLAVFERILRLSFSLKSHPKIEEQIIEIVGWATNELNEKKDKPHYTLKISLLLIELSIKTINISDLKLLLSSMIELYKNDSNIILKIYDQLLTLSYFENDKTAQKEIFQKISDTYVISAQYDISKFSASDKIKKAIEYLAKISSNTRPQRLALYELMRDYQREGLEELGFVSTNEVNLSESAKIAEKRVQGTDIFDTLIRFSLAITTPSDIENIIKQSRERCITSITGIFDSAHFDHDGLKVASVSAGDSIKENSEEKVWEATIQQIKIEHQLKVKGSILPALETINYNYNLTEDLLYGYIKNNPFVPSGHEMYFIKGIIAGFRGDFLTANHLLIPQLENSLRYLLECSGEEPTILHNDGDQERESFKNLLENVILQERMSKNILDNFKILLLDKIYGDQRNQLSHGYVPSSYFFQPSSIFLWWLIFHILMLPFYPKWKEIYLENYSMDNGSL